MNLTRLPIVVLFLLLCGHPVALLAQASYQPATLLYHDLERVKETKRVLYVAAHPDDENTRLIAFLANEEKADIHYLSLTRGDGGQNLIGKELGIGLGYIRTHELLKARATDGGEQLFSRALDFGFSKNPDETFQNWDKETLLGDVVFLIRKYQPDIIINRFNTTPGITHGHHTASAILAIEAFRLAADPQAYPEQLEQVEPWQAKRVFWNAYNWGGQYEPKEEIPYHRYEVGMQNPLLGATYSQIAADSRTMHKSQGFGATPQKGAAADFLEFIQGESFDQDPFDGVSSRWELLPNGKTIAEGLQQALDNFDFRSPSQNVPALVELYREMSAAYAQVPAFWLQEKRQRLQSIIERSLHFQAEFLAKKEIGYAGESLTVNLEVNQHGTFPFQLERFEGKGFQENLNRNLKPNQAINQEVQLQLAKDHPISQPFWLANPIEDNLFTLKDPLAVGPPVNPPAVSGTLQYTLLGQRFEKEIGLYFRYNDQVDGEVQQPFTVIPDVLLSMNQNLVFTQKSATPEIRVTVSFRSEIREGEIQVEGVDASHYRVRLIAEDKRRQTRTYTVRFEQRQAQPVVEALVYYQTRSGERFAQNMQRISYPHIPNLTYFQPTRIKILHDDFQISQQRIGYIAGAGDDVAEVLSMVGYQVELLDLEKLDQEALQKYGSIVTGIRSLNVNQSLADHMEKLLAYVEAGGNLVLQYNTLSPLLTREFGPYPLQISRARVTVEGSPVRFDAEHPLLTGPNPIREEDFSGWVQERGLYFLGEWDERYAAPLVFADPGEEETRGALVTAPYGKGHYTYSGISWFRQLPAGVPGALKLFINSLEVHGR
ncbi:MAG: PIG-L family deacetylase [Nitritalea sp.]